MKKIFLGLLLFSFFLATPALTFAKTAASATKTTYKAQTPDGYIPITWASASGIASFFKMPDNSGSIDYLTRIYLPQNQINFIIATSTPVNLNLASSNYDSTSQAQNNTTSDISAYPNLSFERLGAETAKTIKPSIKFLWDAPFFNMKTISSDLSMAAKYSVGTSTTITSGSRSVPDMALSRRMLVINNETGKAVIKDFNSAFFIDNKNGDLAIEGFAPTVAKSDNASAAASRLFLGVSDDNKELIVYCSKLATVGEASNALTNAGIPPDHQLQADGGGSAACGYNMPGQFFVEPIRTLPLLMGAETIAARVIVKTDILNVRSGPSTKNSIVNKLKKGSTIRAYEEKNGWYKIGDGQWVLKTLITTQ
jgi:rhodanese-related sulfurtransferase